MSHSDASSRVGGGEASLGDAQADNPPDSPDMIFGDAPPLDADTDYEGEAALPEERDNEDPSPNAP